MTALEQARERFNRAMAGVERALETMGQQHARRQKAETELEALKLRHAALQAEHAALQKSYDRLLKQQQSIAGRLEGTIGSLQEVLGA
ncbi:MAG TPA: hypothetical protein VFW37_10810 [Alphaproteobacteria bacterium]|nr:hypothetical protein [Alphaproteobacteria bacterium]